MSEHACCTADSVSKKLAKEYKLSEFEQEAFVERLSDMEKTDLVVAKMLNISRDRYSSRMTGVYKKFRIAGRGAGKANKLFFKVLDIYKKDNPSGSYGIENDALERLVNDTQIKIQPLIKKKCASMRILDMSNSVAIKEIFTEVRIRDQIKSSRHIDISELITQSEQKYKLQAINPQVKSQVSTEKISGVDIIKQHKRLMILGKPGAGKTTFLKHIALLLSERSDVLSGYIPVFISLNDFCAEEQSKSLLDYIFADLSSHGIENDNLEILIKNGRFIFLLDGLDEVKESKISHVIRQIRLLSQNF